MSSPAPSSSGPVVLHVLEALETGCARHVVDVVEWVDGVRHEVVVPSERVGGATDRTAVARIEAAGGRVHVVEMRRLPIHWRNVVATFRLLRLIRQLRPDVVHGHSSIGGALGRVTATLARRDRPLRVYTPNGLAAGAVASGLERLLGRLTDVFVAVSPSERDEVLRRRLVPEGRLVTIPNGVDPERPPPADLRAVAGIPDGVPLVGSMGRLAPQKAPDVLIATFERIAGAVPDAHFVLIGDGPLASEVERLIDAAGLRGVVHRVPVLPEAARYLGSLDVFVLTSRFEGGPYAPLEAMRAGVPVVLTAVVGSRDTVVDGESGRLVPPEDPAAAAAAVIELLEDPERRTRLAEGGRRAVVDRFDLRAAAQATGSVYARAAGRRSR